MAITSHPFIDYLDSRLDNELPGHKGQLTMAPVPIKGDLEQEFLKPPNNEVRRSSVLVLLLPSASNTHSEDSLELLFTLRSEKIEHHGGQISFPGGKAEPNESPEDTALRETKEETGISPHNIKLLGRLTDLYVFRSNNDVQPIVGYCKERPDFTPDPIEVSEIFTVPLSHLVDPNRKKRERWQLHSQPYSIPYWRIHRVPLWGATAMMLGEFIQIYEEYLSTKDSR